MNTFETNINNTCCFTGHRPKKLPWKEDEEGVKFALNKRHILEAINEAIDNGYTHFVTGMAMGFDIYCAELILEIQKTNPAIILECAVPCKEQASKWKDGWKERHEAILENANHVEYICESYTRFCMAKRNKYMVDKSSLVIALFDKISGGTQKTLVYAESKKKKIILIKP